jgi:hypothetical protein
MEVQVGRVSVLARPGGPRNVRGLNSLNLEETRVRAMAKLAFIFMSAPALNMCSLHAQQTATLMSTVAAADSKSRCGLNPSDGSTKIADAWLSDVKGEVQLAKRPGERIYATGARLALLDGAGRVEGPFGTAELIKKRTFTFSSVGQSKPAVAHGCLGLLCG